jgi:Icc protein
MPLRLAIVTDIHHGLPNTTKRGDAALGLLAEFATFAKASGATHVLDLGDRITDADHDTDIALEAEVAEALRATGLPTWHICGNHDRDYLSVAENEAVLGQSLGNETIDIGGWRIVLWRADSKISRKPGQQGFNLPEADLIWLANVALAADRPLLVASHVPVSGHSQIGNYYFQANPEYATYPMAERARAALALARVPVVCIAGHVHWNTITTQNGITHLTQQSLTEGFTTGGAPAGAMGILDLDETVTWEVSGLDPVRFAFRPTAARWTPVLPPFGELPELRARTQG